MQIFLNLLFCVNFVTLPQGICYALKPSLMLDYTGIFRSFVKGDVHPLYAQMYPGLIRYASGILDTRLQFLAEDTVQQALMKAYESRRDFKDSFRWRTWLYVVIRNNALEYMRRAGYCDSYLESRSSDDFTEADVSVAMIEQETLDAIFAAIDSLPEAYRQIFQLSFREGLKNQEIAELLNVAEITIKKRKARLIALLREKLGDDAPLLLILLSASLSTCEL